MTLEVVLIGLALCLVAAAGPVAPLLVPSLTPDESRLWHEAPRESGKGSTGRTGSVSLRRRSLPWLVTALAVCIAVIPAIRAGVEARGAGAPITGSLPGSPALPTTSSGFLRSLQAQVASSPDDVQTRLALARAEFSKGSLGAAADQYLAILQLDPSDAEARARLGFVLATAGHAKAGLDAVDAAMQEDPSYHEALFLRGVILLKYLHEPAAAVRALRSFLAAHQPGPETVTAKKVLASTGH